MAHELYEIDGEFSMAYYGDKPWHGLGQEVSADASIEEWIKQSHTDFEIIRTPATYFTPDGEIRVVDNQDALIRNDNHAFLSHVSPRYNVTQPAELVRFFESLIKTGGFTMTSAGSILNGKRIWATASVNQSVKIAGVDELKGFLLLAGSCDKSLSNVARFTNTRVVCNNTLTAAIPNRARGVDIRIPHSQKFDPEAVKVELGLAKEAFDDHVKTVRLLTKTEMSRKDAVKYFLEIFLGAEEPEPKPEKKISLAEAGLTPTGARDVPEDLAGFLDEVVSNTDPEKMKEEMKAFNSREDDAVNIKKVPVSAVLKMTDLLENGKGQDLKTAKGTAWGALNAVTEYVDHHQRSRSLDHKINSVNFGKGATIKQKAFEIITAKAA